ncbi:hypothetical protein Fcan01_01131 [Folsomia candida]|uniref:Uncharacterized protein n=1 Tax=Folsomia candida TaxID=158441 RepID=A0A226F7K0_FOLCA|nr:hypothetical protein Fcan01_01131 [Folsomia candida]
MVVAPFQSATSPEEIGLHDLAGSQIWFIKSYQPTDSNIDFRTSFDLPKWICKGTQVQINIQYFSSLASVTVWPVVDKGATHGRSSYANLPDFNEGWVNFVAYVDIDRSEQIVIDGVIMPMGHFILDEVIFLYAGGDCFDDGTTTGYPVTFTTTRYPTTSRTTYYWDTPSTTDESTTRDYWQDSTTTRPNPTTTRGPTTRDWYESTTDDYWHHPTTTRPNPTTTRAPTTRDWYEPTTDDYWHHPTTTRPNPTTTRGPTTRDWFESTTEDYWHHPTTTRPNPTTTRAPTTRDWYDASSTTDSWHDVTTIAPAEFFFNYTNF